MPFLPYCSRQPWVDVALFLAVLVLVQEALLFTLWLIGVRIH